MNMHGVLAFGMVSVIVVLVFCYLDRLAIPDQVVSRSWRSQWVSALHIPSYPRAFEQGKESTEVPVLGAARGLSQSRTIIISKVHEGTLST